MQSTSHILLFRAMFASLVILVAGAADLLAQDCGEYCGPCGAGSKEGWSHNENGEYNMNCKATDEGCPQCGGITMLVSDLPKEMDLLTALKSAPMASLRAAVGTLRDRLLVYPERNMIAVRGERCAANSIVAVAFLPADRVAALATSGLPRLENFLAEGQKGLKQAVAVR